MFGRKSVEIPQPSPFLDGRAPRVSDRFPEKWLRKGRLLLTDSDLTPIAAFKSGFEERLKHGVFEVCFWNGQDESGQFVAVNAFRSKRWGNNQSVVIQMPNKNEGAVSGLQVGTFDMGPEIGDWSFDKSKGAVHIDKPFEIASFFLMVVKAAKAGIGFFEANRAFKEAVEELKTNGVDNRMMDYFEINQLKKAFSRNLAKNLFLT